ncbi:MAG: enoyl-CoA hydratase/isomerase family protein [Solirubrobacterales bacterium]|nr:enoyl-CoA hydratase/isomerase family protein [Solirubrobacterales bacterium]
MSESESVKDQYSLERKGEVAILTLNRPERLNALTWELMHELHAALDEVRADDSIRLLVLTGAGRGFCSGLDIMRGDPLGGDDGILTVLERQELVANLAVKLRKLPIPVIAAVNGPATGAGFALALAADIRICSPEAKFSAAFVRIGISACDVGVSYMLPRIVGHGAASEIMLTGNLVDAEQAQRIGLVSRVEGDVVEAALEFGADITRNSPFGVRMTKEVLALSVDAPSIEAAVEMENRTQVLATRTEDMSEAVAAFKEKRAARFRYR